jgi:hypothetical protein
MTVQRAMQYAAPLVSLPQHRGLLDAPLSQGMTAEAGTN